MRLDWGKNNLSLSEQSTARVGLQLHVSAALVSAVRDCEINL